MESPEWELNLTIRRRPSNRKLGLISQSEVEQLRNKMAEMAAALGLVLGGTPAPKRANCDVCGRIISNVMLGKCQWCGARMGL